MHIPFLIEKLIKDRESNFQDFFNLETLPDNTKELKKAAKVIKDFRYDIDDAISESKSVIKSCDKDCLDDAQKSAISLDGIVNNMDGHIEELEKIIQQWEYAYESLLSLTTEIINKEKIDLENYSSNITETELKSYRRIIKLNKLLGK